MTYRYLLPDRGRTGKQKTPVVKNSVNPEWNHTLVFDSVDAMELADRSLELTVWDHEKLGTNEFLGGVRLNLGLGQCVLTIRMVLISEICVLTLECTLHSKLSGSPRTGFKLVVLDNCFVQQRPARSWQCVN